MFSDQIKGNSVFGSDSEVCPEHQIQGVFSDVKKIRAVSTFEAGFRVNFKLKISSEWFQRIKAKCVNYVIARSRRFSPLL